MVITDDLDIDIYKTSIYYHYSWVRQKNFEVIQHKDFDFLPNRRCYTIEVVQEQA